MMMCILVTTFFCAADAPRVHVIGLTETQGEFRGIARTGTGFALLVGAERIPLEDIVRATLPAPQAPAAAARPGIIALLPDRSELAGDLASAAEERLRLRNASLGEVELPLDKLLALVFPRAFPTAAASDQFRVAVRTPPQSDTLFTTDGGSVRGIVESVSAEAVTVKADALGTVAFPMQKVRGLALAQIDVREAPVRLQVGVVLRDGSTIWGAPADGNEKSLKLETSFGAFTLPFDAAASLLVAGGRWVMLSEIAPEAIDEKSYVGDRVWHLQRDANVLGGPLKARGVRYQRGLGVHSYSKLTYRLEKRYARFEALAAVDDCAVDENLDTRFGNVVFKVAVDGQERFTSGEVSWNDAPRAVSVDTANAETLSLEVDWGAGFHVRDRADWIEARLLRAPK